MEQIKPSIVNIYFKQLHCHPIEAYLAISKMVKILESSKIFFWNFQGCKFYSIINYQQKSGMVFCGVFY